MEPIENLLLQQRKIFKQLSNYKLKNYSKILILNNYLNIISDKYGINLKSLKGKTRIREIVEARQLFCATAKHLNPKISYKIIGSIINRDHSTVLYSIKTVKNIKSLQKEFKEIIKFLNYEYFKH